MTNETNQSEQDMGSQQELTAMSQAQIVVKKKEGASIAWLLPVVALVIACWLVYKSVVNAPHEFIVEFPHGADIKPLKTELKFYGITMGTVKKVDISEDFETIMATIEIDQRVKGVLQADTQFWLVEPELSFSRVAGLDTLVSGKYITFQFGDKTAKLEKSEIGKLQPAQQYFKALLEPPPRPDYLGGLNLTLKTNKAASFQRGTPILYQRLNVGTVERIRLSEKGDEILIDIYIEEPYVKLIKSDTRFWNISGLRIGGGIGNLDIKLESISSLMVGGISFSVPSQSKNSKPAKSDTLFKLHEHKEAAFDKGVAIRLEFSSSEGIEDGTLIKYKKQLVGEIRDIELSDDLKTIYAQAMLTKSGRRIAREGSVFWVIKPKLGLASTKNLDTLVKGQYIAVQPGDGKWKVDFIGAKSAPITREKSTGLNIVLTSPALNSVKKGVKITYRSIPVGKVKGFELAENARHVLIYANIESRYEGLIHENTRFWQSSGVGVDFSLFSGAKIRTESLESMLEGGISLATPDNEAMGEQAKDGAEYKLYKEPDEEWSGWSPNIAIPAAEGGG